jgi:serine/threonine-protein kinase
VKQDPENDRSAPPEDPVPASRRGWVEGPGTADLNLRKSQLASAPDIVMEGTAGFDIEPSERPPASAYDIPAGTVLAGKYRVVRTIGRGGMGLVVEARHTQIDTRVAIKILLREFLAFPEAPSRFLREARNASRLESHHVARVTDVGTLETGEPYMVMEYLAGEDLAYHLDSQQDPLPIQDAIDYVAQACDAIAEAHQAGIVHRDIKPANLFLTRRSDGSAVVKVLDFGVSKVVGDAEGGMTLTQTTMILGSALYMSPEQMQSAKKVDQRTDIYALGVCLYEMLSRKLPYYADSFPELCAKIFTQPPTPLKELRPEIPEGLVQAVERALTREPDKRYQSVAEFVQALSPYARPATRTQMEVLLRRFGPQLELLPPIDPPEAKADKPAPKRESAAPSEKGKAQEKEERRSRAPIFIWIGALLLGGLIAWGVFRAQKHTPTGPDVASDKPPAGAGSAAPASTPSAEALSPSGTVPAVAAPETSASAAASDAGPAPADAGTDAASDAAAPADAGSDKAAADKTGGTAKSGGTHAPAGGGNTGSGTGSDLGTTGGSNTTLTPPPPVNNDLTQERCFARMPDGSRVEVPCN